MENIGFIHIVMLAANTLAALYWGWLLTETRHRLADKHPLLDRKPFSCRPCLTFHIGWILAGITSMLIASPAYFIAGAGASLFAWMVLEIENKGKIDE